MRHELLNVVEICELPLIEYPKYGIVEEVGAQEHPDDRTHNI